TAARACSGLRDSMTTRTRAPRAASGLYASMPSVPAEIVVGSLPSDTFDQRPLAASILSGAMVRAADPVRSGRAAVRGDAAGADASTNADARTTPATAAPEIVVLIACIGALL